MKPRGGRDVARFPHFADAKMWGTPRCGWALEFDQDVVAFNLDLEDLGLYGGIVGYGARLGVVGPAVPGADDLALHHDAGAERAAAVDADVVHGRDDAT